MKQLTVGIIGNGPVKLIPELSRFKHRIDVWIGADRGALHLIENRLPVAFALGDFDSVTAAELAWIENHVEEFEKHPIEKDKTDMEIALDKAYTMNPAAIYLFGATGARIDHEMINMQLLQAIYGKGIKGMIVDQQNYIEWTEAGEHEISHDSDYPNVSLIPMSKVVKNVTLTGFYYEAEQLDIHFGSTRTISNKVITESATLSFEEGELLLIKSNDKKNK